MESYKSRKLRALLRYLRIVTWRLVSDKTFSLPIYLYAIAITSLSALIYSVASTIPDIEKYYSVVDLFVAFLAFALLGKSFWRILVRHILIKIGLERFAPLPNRKMQKLADHLRPSFDAGNTAMVVLRYFAACSHALLFFVARMEVQMMNEVERRVKRK